MIIPNFLLTPRKSQNKKTEEMLEIALSALEIYACDIRIHHNPQFARTALMKIYAKLNNKELHIGDQIKMPVFKCKSCKQTFVSLRNNPTCPYCGKKTKGK